MLTAPACLVCARESSQTHVHSSTRISQLCSQLARIDHCSRGDVGGWCCAYIEHICPILSLADKAQKQGRVLVEQQLTSHTEQTTVGYILS